jgi:AcrR family transcriptional regulator
VSHPTAGQEPRWRRLPEERPRQLIDAALEVFGEHGLAGARLEDIAKRAGVSKGTIYLYFPNKEALFREMIRQKVIEEIERAEHLPADGTAVEQLRRHIEGYWAFLRSPTFETIYRLVHGELHHFPDLARFYSREVIQRGSTLTAQIIRRGVERGEFRDVEPVMAGRMLASMLLSHAVWCSRRDFFHHVAGKTDEQCIREITDFYFHALLHDSGASRPGA